MNLRNFTAARAGERWLILAVLFLARTAMGFQFQAVAALSSFVVADFRIDYTQLGLLIGLYLLPGILIAYPGGLLGQYFGDKRIAVLGMALMVVGGLLTATSDYALFIAGRLISGVGAVLLNVLLTKMATDWFAGREIGTALALLVSSWPIGIGIALISLPWLAVQAAAALAFASSAIAAGLVLVLIAAFYYVPPSVPIPLQSNNGERSRLSMSEFGLVSLAGGIWMLFNVGYILIVSFGPALLVSHGQSQQEAGALISLVAWVVILTIPLGGVLIDRIGHATTLMIASLGAFGLGVMLLPISPSLPVMAFIGAVVGLPAGAIMVLPGEVLRPQNRSAGMGVFFTWYYAGMALLTPVAGILRDATNEPSAPLVFAAALEFAAIIVLIVLRLAQRQSKPWS
jgi:MFS family permease